MTGECNAFNKNFYNKMMVHKIDCNYIQIQNMYYEALMFVFTSKGWVCNAYEVYVCI